MYAKRSRHYKKQAFADVVQNRCSKKFRAIHRKTSVLESFLNKVAGLKTCNFIKKTLTQSFSCEYCEIFKNKFFIEHLRWLGVIPEKEMFSFLLLHRYLLFPFFYWNIYFKYIYIARVCFCSCLDNS